MIILIIVTTPRIGGLMRGLVQESVLASWIFSAIAFTIARLRRRGGILRSETVTRCLPSFCSCLFLCCDQVISGNFQRAI